MYKPKFKAVDKVRVPKVSGYFDGVIIEPAPFYQDINPETFFWSVLVTHKGIDKLLALGCPRSQAERGAIKRHNLKMGPNDTIGEVPEHFMVLCGNSMKNLTKKINLLKSLIESAQIEWTGADWCHEYKVHGVKHVDSHGDFEYCEGGSTTCDTCSLASKDAEEACASGESALTILNSDNDLTLEDLHMVARYMLEASSLESNWGDTPNWGIPLEIIEELTNDFYKNKQG